MPDKECGFIVVSPDDIRVRFQQRNGITEAGYNDVTVETLQDAARVLASWMSLKYEDVGKECRRIHARDQQMAFLMDCIEQSQADSR